MKFIYAIISTIIFSVTVASQSILESRVHVPQPQPGESRYFYIPFDVPAGTESLSVNISYDKKNGTNVLDLGLFDSRFTGAAGDLSGFRGWSGGRRSSIFIAKDTASNGYLPGAVPAGEWRIILGLYKVVPGGVDVAVQIRLNRIDENAKSDLEKENVRSPFAAAPHTAPVDHKNYLWYRGDLHMHTFHSDGNWTVESLADYAAANRLDFIAITEHNTTAHHPGVKKFARKHEGLLVMRGEEITTYGGHVNTWGLPDGKLIDFRVTPANARELAAVVASVREAGLLASINHPTALCGGCGWTYGDDWAGMDSVEIWNGPWDPTDEAALKKWDELLQKGSRITAIGSSDSHRPPSDNPEQKGSPLGLPTTFVGANLLDERSLFAAIRARRVFVADNPQRFLSLSSGYTVIGGELTAKAGSTQKFNVEARNFPERSVLKIIVDGNPNKELKLKDGNLKSTEKLEFSNSGWTRLEVRSETGAMLAFTNPIFIKVEK